MSDWQRINKKTLGIMKRIPETQYDLTYKKANRLAEARRFGFRIGRTCTAIAGGVFMLLIIAAGAEALYRFGRWIIGGLI